MVSGTRIGTVALVLHSDHGFFAKNNDRRRRSQKQHGFSPLAMLAGYVAVVRITQELGSGRGNAVAFEAVTEAPRKTADRI